MSPLANWNPQWLNQNSQRSYPLTDWATGVCPADPAIVIPNDFILAFYFPVHAGLDVEPDRFFLSRLGISPTGYTVEISYDDGTATPPVVGSVGITRDAHTEAWCYAVAGVNDFDDSVGKIVIGRLASIDRLPPGNYQFDRAAAALETDCIRPIIRGISSITVVNGQERSERLYGHIEFVAGENIRLRTAATSGSAPQIIWDAISGEGLNEDCVCETDDTGTAIQSINGIPPYPDGNFRFVGDDCIEIVPIDHGLQLQDKCSKPCCACDDLEAIVRQIERFADGALTLQNFVSRLQAEVGAMQSALQGSRLAGQGCIDY